jgi:hypothetical protein
VDNSTTNKSVAILKACIRIMNTQCVKIPIPANVKNFLKHYDVAMCCPRQPRRRTCCIPYMEWPMIMLKNKYVVSE